MQKIWEGEKVRLQEAVKQLFIEELQTASVCKKEIQHSAFYINGIVGRTGTFVNAGDEILYNPERKEVAPKAYDLPLDIIYEDDQLALIYKPAGIEVSGNKYRTIQNAIIGQVKNSKAADALPWPMPVHRLDYVTTGLLLIAKTKTAQVSLGNQFENQEISKKYLAIAIGNVESGDFTGDVDGKEAFTSCEVIEKIKSVKNDMLTYVALYPKTGRKHQLRIHLLENGTPILGDKKYGLEQQKLKHKGVFLSSVGIAFKHPLTNEEKEFQVEPPTKFLSLLDREKKWYKRAKSDEVQED